MMIRGLTSLALAAALAGAQSPPTPAVLEMPFDSAAASRLPHQGVVVAGRRWRDATGEHTLLLTQTGKLPSRVPAAELPVEDDPAYDAEVYAYHYTVPKTSSAPRLVWRTADFERGCQFDLYAGHLLQAVTLTDLDRDGVAETTIVYTLACRSDVSPATRKLIMHEGSAKYAIRGTTRPAGQEGGGEMVVDPAFSRAPRAFRSYAIAQWRRWVTVDAFEQF